MSKRSKFSTEFKQEAVQLSHDSNVSVSQAACEIGVKCHSGLTLQMWPWQLLYWAYMLVRADGK